MTPDAIDRIRAWLIAEGLTAESEVGLLHGLCAQLNAAGVPLDHGMALIDTLHPVYEGRAIRWRRDGREENALVEYGRTESIDAQANWQSSPFYRLLESGESELRVPRPSQADATALSRMNVENQSDYVAHVHRFGGLGVIGEMECVYSHWTTSAEGGFSDDHLAALRAVLPSFALALKSMSLARVAATLVRVYLGDDAGQRVLSGNMRRGVADPIRTVLWFSDLRGFTRISDTAEPGEIIPLLNDYAETAIAAIHGGGGDVLKLIGDGVLAVFRADDPTDATTRALRAAGAFSVNLRTLNERRRAAGRPVTAAYLGLHLGEVFYGNIGSDDRLDFTVVGPAVNEVSRIASMCRSVEQPMLVSTAFAEALPPGAREHMVSVGRFALRGVGQPQHLYAWDPTAMP